MLLARRSRARAPERDSPLQVRVAVPNRRAWVANLAGIWVGKLPACRRGKRVRKALALERKALALERKALQRIEPALAGLPD